MRKMACGLCLVPRRWEDAHGSLLLSKDLFVLPSPWGTCSMWGNDSFCYHTDISVSVTISPFSKKHYFSWLSPSWKMWPLKPKWGERRMEGRQHVLATQKLNGVLWDNQSIGLEGYKSIYVHAERKHWTLHCERKRDHFVLPVQV